jgi:hypothetical protein
MSVYCILSLTARPKQRFVATATIDFAFSKRIQCCSERQVQAVSGESA